MIKHCTECVGPVCTACGTIHDPAHEGRYGKAVKRLADAFLSMDTYPLVDREEAKRHYLRERFKAAQLSPDRDPRGLSAEA
jgi:hypothetical protein